MENSDFINKTEGIKGGKIMSPEAYVSNSMLLILLSPSLSQGFPWHDAD